MTTTMLDASPTTLRSREDNQERIDEVRSYFEGRELEPIVAVDYDGYYEILDGHHRAMLAEERGCPVPAVTITEAQCEAMEEAGYGALTIAYAALMLAGETNAAMGIEMQDHMTFEAAEAESAVEMLRVL